jgi:DNA polymerase-3 subunit alpha (Gram-positive type)
MIANNVVAIYVANEDEVAMIDELVDELRNIFEDYGLKVLVKVTISSFETPIVSIIEENLKVSDQEIYRDQQQFDEYVKSGQKPETEPSKGKFKKVPRGKSKINQEPTPLRNIPASETEVIEYRQRFGSNEFVIVADIIQSQVIEKVKRGPEQKKFKIYQALVTDNEDSISIKTFINLAVSEQVKFYESEATVGKKARILGYVEYDKYSKDVILNITEMLILGETDKKERLDDALVRRVELHAHTKMTVLDGVMDVDEYVKQAVKFKHRALAVTDLYNIHVLPDFYNATKNLDILPIFGVEGALVDETKFKIALDDGDFDLRNATYIVYDLETTGLSSNYNEIIEIAAVKIKNGLIIDEFSTYVKPKLPITDFITELTSITNDDVRNADPIETVLPKFKKFIDGCVLVAHNATFDNSHLYQNLRNLNLYEGPLHTIDTLQLAKVRYGHKLKKFNLKAVTKYFDVELEQHHRAIYDAKATAYVFIKMLHDFIDDKITNYKDINSSIDENDAFRLAYPTHLTILSRNLVGKKNLYKIISDSHTVHFSKEPRILKTFLSEHREGLLIGSGCINGEVFEIAYEKSYDELKEAISFYDFIEVQPPSVCEVLVEKNKDNNVRGYIKETIVKIIKAAKEMKKIVVATGDVHHLNKEDVKLREVYVDAPKLGGGTHKLNDLEKLPSFHFMTTNEMLDEFKFLGQELAYEIVVTNSNLIADKIEKYELFPQKLFAPGDDSFKEYGIPSFKQGVIDMSYANARKHYGPNLPKYIEDRIEKELNSIIGNNFSSIYYISHLLVKHSTDAGYVVGSRGSVGSSLIAYLMKITEVNPLPPHYTCKKCHCNAIKFSEEEKKIYPRTEAEILLEDKLNNADTGYDLEEAFCPVCHEKLEQDGVDIPFETFLGFKGDKVPDIDLNFSSEYQSQAHEFCRELFGVDHAFRAGTISTIADKTAFGYVKKYFEKRGIQVRNAEINRIVSRIVGVKRSTGQHPGGIVILPKDIEYTDLIPIQYPADDVKASWRTTHFDYHKFESNLLKLDILGHDDPTMIRHLMDFVEKYPDEFPFSKVEDIPLTDKEVFALFNGLSSLKITPDQMNGETIGTTGLPEFGTALTKDMLAEIRPTTVSDLLKVSGLSHGTDVWNGNSRDFLLGLRPEFPKVPFKELIGCRDDIMVYLMSKNIPANDAFKIMESVRKGKSVSKDFEKEMIAYNIPRWYIESCKLIKYMFPKAHATAYVIMALRIGWFKVHRPIYYYAAYFSRRADAFDVNAMARGYEAIKIKLLELQEKVNNNIATAKEIDTHYSLLLSLEMTARGFKFIQMDINLSDATNFKVSKDRMSLLIPFNALESLGDTTAISIVKAREESKFTSKKDIMKRTKINNTQFEKMNLMGSFGMLPDDDQIGLF